MVGASFPMLSAWYRDPQSGRSFQIVAIDEDNDGIDIQYLDGDLSELDFAGWTESGFIPVEQPEDWSAPYDEMEVDDLGYTDTDRHERDADDFSLDDLLNDED